MKDTTVVTLWLVEERERANKYQDRDGGTDYWIPRSLIHHQHKEPPEADGRRMCQVEVEDWKLNELGLL